MKLTNILLVSLAALLAMNSCKKDDVVNGTEGTENDARLNIDMLASKAAGSDVADTEEQEGEAVVNNVAVVVFNATGTQLLSTPFQEKVSSTNNVISILNVPVQSTVARIVIVANCPDNAFADVTTYTDMQSRLAQLANQTINNLTMSSQVIVTDAALEAGDNYLGFTSQGTENINGISEPLELTRLTARIDLNNVKTTFTGDMLGTSVRIDEISLENVKTASHFFSEDYWGVIMAEANLATTYPVTISGSKKLISNGSPQTNLCRVYVMENQDESTPTALVVKATLVNSSGIEIGEQRRFTSVINSKGTVLLGDAHKYVKRNYVYRLNVNFTNGSFNDLVGSMDVAVDVVAWSEVQQQHPVID